MHQKEPVHSQPVSSRDGSPARITDRAYALYAQRGYRQGYALDDWLEAEREILGLDAKRNNVRQGCSVRTTTE